ncbi:MAG: iron dicitrate transport regulator FecR, partial [Planctomycetota bacterium]
MDSIIAELESLLFEWDAGSLDDAGIQRIRDLLRSSKEARSFFVEHQMLNAAMKLDIDAGLDPLADGPKNSSPGNSKDSNILPAPVDGHTGGGSDSSQNVFRISYWGAALAGLLVCGLAGRLLQLEFSGKLTKGNQSAVANVPTTTNGESQEPTSEGVALVTRLVDVRWAADQNPLEVGDALSPGRLAIDAGYAQIEFFCGATVVVEGPAELDLRSPLLAQVRSGRLRAQVPPAARGFSLVVDDMKVVDLGTEFGLSVSSEGANVQVFDGEVEIQQPEAEKRLLAKGMALLRNREG